MAAPVDMEGLMAARILYQQTPMESQRLIDLLPRYFERQDQIFQEQLARGEPPHLTEEMLVGQGLSTKDVAELYAVEHEVLEEQELVE
jgi:hypothetical protein